MYCKEIYGSIPPRCVSPKCQAAWEEAVKQLRPGVACLSPRARDMPPTPISSFIESYVERTAFAHLRAASQARFLVRTMSNVSRKQQSTPAFTRRYGHKVCVGVWVCGGGCICAEPLWRCVCAMPMQLPHAHADASRSRSCAAWCLLPVRCGVHQSLAGVPSWFAALRGSGSGKEKAERR